MKSRTNWGDALQGYPSPSMEAKSRSIQIVRRGVGDTQPEGGTRVLLIGQIDPPGFQQTQQHKQL